MYDWDSMKDKDNHLRIALTFDIEGMYHANVKGLKLKDEYQASYLDKEVDYLLGLCDQFSIKATFFIVADLAHKHKDTIRKIYNRGHEIASHSLSHKLLYTLTNEQLKVELGDSKRILEDLIGEQVTGFRAPSWSVSKDISAVYYDALSSEGYQYSSSVFPGKNFLYGIPDAPTQPHKTPNGIVEFPMPTFSFLGKRLGFTGGFYYRLFPFWFSKRLIIYRLNKGEKLFLYFHPWEFPLKKYDLEARLSDKLILSFHRNLLAKRFHKLMEGNKIQVYPLNDYVDIIKKYDDLTSFWHS